jgi:hypothetical protein
LKFEGKNWNVEPETTGDPKRPLSVWPLVQEIREFEPEGFDQGMGAAKALLTVKLLASASAPRPPRVAERVVANIGNLSVSLETEPVNPLKIAASRIGEQRLPRWFRNHLGRNRRGQPEKLALIRFDSAHRQMVKIQSISGSATIDQLRLLR